jgi:membrane-associated protease RseP (regulator of RpoE activity)
MTSTNSNEHTSGWKWAAIIIGVILLAMLTCVIGSITGGLFGYLVGRRATVTRPYRMPEMPRDWDPMPPETPDRPPAPDNEGTPWLGVAFMTVEDGAEVNIVMPGSPADEAGIRVGDVIAEVNGNKVTESRPLDDHILRYRPGDRVRLTILRNGSKQRITVRLGSQADRFPGRQENLLPHFTPLPPDQGG